MYLIAGDQDVVEQVLAMQDEVGGDLELVVEQTLVTQASRLLEETDFTNVLNQIPPDEFNDLFAGELDTFLRIQSFKNCLRCSRAASNALNRRDVKRNVKVFLNCCR